MVNWNDTSYVRPRLSRTVVNSRELMTSVSSMRMAEENSGWRRRASVAACRASALLAAPGTTTGGGTTSPCGYGPIGSPEPNGPQRGGAGPATYAAARSSLSCRCHDEWRRSSVGSCHTTGYSMMGVTAVGGRGATVPRYVATSRSSSCASKSPTTLISSAPACSRPITVLRMPSSVSASISSGEGSRKRRTSGPPIMTDMMRSAVARSSDLDTERDADANAVLARSAAASSQRGCSSSRCASWNVRSMEPSPTAKWKSTHRFSSSASIAQLMRLDTQYTMTCSRSHLPTAPASLSVRMPTVTAPYPSGAAPSLSMHDPPGAIMRSSAARGSLSVTL
mmetsp:Transcript_1371/g.3739  ORF Transcript_1371/g.3739 Transcript_1371/m.3739 type:complete len:337 (-) Transcript_1371:2469-3479(-)